MGTGISLERIMGSAVGNLSYIVPIPGFTFLTKWIEVAMVGSGETAQGCQAGLEGACNGKDEGTRAYLLPLPS